MQTLPGIIDQGSGVGWLAGDLPRVQPRTASGAGRGWHRRPMRSLRRADGTETALSQPPAFLQPSMRRDQLGGTQTGADTMTPTRYCYPSPCPNGHPLSAVHRSQWLFAAASRWRCGLCGATWERPAYDYPPSLAQRFPAFFKDLRALNKDGTPFQRLAGAMQFWLRVSEQEST